MDPLNRFNEQGSVLFLGVRDQGAVNGSENHAIHPPQHHNGYEQRGDRVEIQQQRHFHLLAGHRPEHTDQNGDRGVQRMSVRFDQRLQLFAFGSSKLTVLVLKQRFLQRNRDHNGHAG
ncbi:hypothetical protein D1872_267940 [compost metagenome]